MLFKATDAGCLRPFVASAFSRNPEAGRNLAVPVVGGCSSLQVFAHAFGEFVPRLPALCFFFDMQLFLDLLEFVDFKLYFLDRTVDILAVAQLARVLLPVLLLFFQLRLPAGPFWGSAPLEAFALVFAEERQALAGVVYCLGELVVQLLLILRYLLSGLLVAEFRRVASALVQVRS